MARGSTTTGTVTIVLTENTAACLTALMVGQSPNPAVSPDLTITLTDDAASAATVDFTGTPTVTAPGSLGASASVSGGDLLINFTGTDTINVEQVTIGGLMVATTAAADLGAVDATLTGPAAGCFVSATTTATGVVSVGIAAGSTSVIINVDDCDFEVTGTPPPPGQLSFATSPELVNITAIAAGPGVGQQTLTIAATANNHLLGETVSQTSVTNCNGALIGTAATVTGRLDLTGTVGGNVFPGENNQLISGATVILTTPGAGSTTDGLPSGSVVTYTLPAGIQFSTPPTVGYAGTITGPATCALSFDRNSCSLTTTAASTAASSITIGTIRVDVAPTVALGTAVTITPTTSPARTIVPANFRVAYVARTVVGVGGIPTIFINVNDQNSGMLTLTETTAGFFRAGVGENNAFGICFTTGEQMTRAPWAVVTAGDLQLLSGAVGAASVQGTLFAGPAIAGGTQSCARWTVYGRAATPLVSTIEIRGADASNVVLPSGANNGPRLNVVPAIGVAGTPGPTLANVLIGQQADVIAGTALSTIVQNAVRAFKSDVTVVAVTQTIVPQGATNSLSGNIKITETLAGQLKAGQDICVEILPRNATGVFQARQDTFFKTRNTNDLPVASTNVASGLLVTRTFTDEDQVCFEVQQQATGTPGELTISNMHLVTLADAPFGNILFRVTGDTDGGAVAFEADRLAGSHRQPGLRDRRYAPRRDSGWRLHDVDQGPGVRRYVTYRFDFGVAAAGQTGPDLGRHQDR